MQNRPLYRTYGGHRNDRTHKWFWEVVLLFYWVILAGVCLVQEPFKVQKDVKKAPISWISSFVAEWAESSTRSKVQKHRQNSETHSIQLISFCKMSENCFPIIPVMYRIVCVFVSNVFLDPAGSSCAARWGLAH